MQRRSYKKILALCAILFVIGGLIIWREYLSLEPEDRSLAWSPDGQRLAFTCRRRRRDRVWRPLQEYLGPYSGQDSSRWYELCVLDLEDEEREQLTSNAHYDGTPAWSPDGRHIAYLSRTTAQYADLKLLTLSDEASTTLITGHKPVGRPLWSPTNPQLAFVSTREGNSNGDLHVFDLDTGETRRLTYMREVSAFTWSPKGDQIGFVGGDYGQEEIFTVSLETESVAQITSSDGHKATPMWSPEGQFIAFTAGELLSQIYVVHATSLEVSLLSTDTDSSHQFPTWSPDGNSLAYIRNSYGEYRSSFLEIQELAQEGNLRSYELATCTILDLQWSPKGEYIALNQCADWNRDGWNEFKIWLFDVNGGEIRPLYTVAPWRVESQLLSNVANP